MRRPTVFIDLDDTILDFGKAESAALTRALTRLGVEPTQSIISRYSEINARQWEKLEEGAIDRQKVLTGRFEILFEELGIAVSGYEAQLLYERELAIGHYFIDGAEQLLKTLWGEYDLYIASNGTASVQAGRIESAGIAKYFKKIFVSEHMGANKPSKAFFELCFAQIDGFDPARAVMVGDSLTSDIRGGINAGIKTCWFNPRGKEPRADIKPDYEIKALSELPPLLKRIFA